MAIGVKWDNSECCYLDGHGFAEQRKVGWCCDDGGNVTNLKLLMIYREEKIKGVWHYSTVYFLEDDETEYTPQTIGNAVRMRLIFDPVKI